MESKEQPTAMSLQECKDYIAQCHDFKNWLHLIKKKFIGEVLTEEMYDTIALYEEEVSALFMESNRDAKQKEIWGKACKAQKEMCNYNLNHFQKLKVIDKEGLEYEEEFIHEADAKYDILNTPDAEYKP